MSDLTAHDVLCAVKSTLMGRGWLQGSFENDTGAVCVLGAFGSAFEQWHWDGDAEDEAARTLENVIGTRLIAEWNDRPGRTFDEVIDALDKAILATAPTPVESKVAA